MVGPDYKRPPVTAPGVFRGSIATAPDPHSIADLKWFEVFQDEQLQELIRTALRRTTISAMPSLESMRHAPNLGITQADQYPNFGIGADVTASEASRRGQFTIPRGTSRQRSFTTVFLNLFTFEIDIWGRLRRATESARAATVGDGLEPKNRDHDPDQRCGHRLFQSSRTGHGIGHCKKHVGHARGIATGDQDSAAGRRRNAFRRAPGRATGLQCRGVDTECRAANRANRKSNQFAAGEKSRSHNTKPPPDGAANTARSAGRLALTLLERRPDIQAAEQILVAANANIGVAKAAYFPQITLTGEFGFQSTALSNLFSGSRRLWSFVPQLTYPIFDAGRTRFGVEQS